MILLGAVLLAGVGAFGLILFAPQPTIPGEVPVSSQTPEQVMTSTTGFSTSILQRPDYASLDLGLISQGRLSVQAPVGAGKADPFQ